jgi:undecaprenyl diphosphate synthase
MTALSDPEALAAPDDYAGEAPRHVAIIMDGNGRWAAARGLPRTEGHRQGVEAVRRTVRAVMEIGFDYLTLFSFSSENWSRPASEVQFLFGLVRNFIRRDLAELHANGVRVSVIGERDGLPRDILGLIEEAERLTAENSRLRLVVAFNYGAHDEIVRAVRRIGAEVKAGKLDPSAIDKAMLTANLDTVGIPDPDIILRTSGEMRLSNFLLWQAAYAELVFLPVFWPDFDKRALETAVGEFSRRVRRYGGLAARSGE